METFDICQHKYCEEKNNKDHHEPHGHNDKDDYLAVLCCDKPRPPNPPSPLHCSSPLQPPPPHTYTKTWPSTLNLPHHPHMHINFWLHNMSITPSILLRNSCHSAGSWSPVPLDGPLPWRLAPDWTLPHHYLLSESQRVTKVTQHTHRQFLVKEIKIMKP